MERIMKKSGIFTVILMFCAAAIGSGIDSTLAGTLPQPYFIQDMFR
ncbi:hypothetical protein TREAZ_0045 [Leadbettera azotonutricia ZAS-9]|uniref:Uncharacterized protein n=1 Tax=Leadbettera azotonutricia (strain ATCC BAA-888 / DSM 13862 / ZAS-9) TaxID=545695 RepID=F5YG35_LEAAZ|nr:hypothetical protein TREAZ_0045 [Leadbettera azotonutricia ZAS-9]